MLIAVLHCIPDSDDPDQLVADLMDAVPRGSFLAVTHPARDQVDIATKAEESLTKSMGQKVTRAPASRCPGSSPDSPWPTRAS